MVAKVVVGTRPMVEAAVATLAALNNTVAAKVAIAKVAMNTAAMVNSTPSILLAARAAVTQVEVVVMEAGISKMRPGQWQDPSNCIAGLAGSDERFQEQAKSRIISMDKRKNYTYPKRQEFRRWDLQEEGWLHFQAAALS